MAVQQDMTPTFSLRPEVPDLSDLPWHLPLAEWQGVCPRLEEMQVGLSRHPVAFVNYDGQVFALKEMGQWLVQNELQALEAMEKLRLPAVTPAGYALTTTTDGPSAVLITRFLEHSIPYRSLFMVSRLERYRSSLLDAMAGLLVQLHLNGVFWGDCSLSNTLYRRDAGALSAYLVDAESAEISPGTLSPALRHQDLDIMEENVDGDLAELAAMHFLAQGIPIEDTSAYIRRRYSQLWDEITRQEYIPSGERYRIQERIRSMNALGYAVEEVEIKEAEGLSRVRLRVAVGERNFHRDLLFGLTGLEAEETQARQMMNEITELKARMASSQNRSVNISAAAYHWLETVYLPTMEKLKPLAQADTPESELYCQLLEHKWFLSERERRDVGHRAALEDYLRQFGSQG